MTLIYGIVDGIVDGLRVACDEKCDDRYNEESENEAVGGAYGVDTGYAGKSTTWLLYGWYSMVGGLLLSKLALAFDRNEGGDDGGSSSS